MDNIEMPIIANVTFWDELDNEMKEEVILLYGKGLKDAGEKLENYYGDTINKAAISFYEAGLMFKVGKEVEKKIKEELS